MYHLNLSKLIPHSTLFFALKKIVQMFTMGSLLVHSDVVASATQLTHPTEPKLTVSSAPNQTIEMGHLIKDLSSALQVANQRQVATQTAWLRLLYYPEKLTSKQIVASQLESRVKNHFNPILNQQQFFASSDGATNPQAEFDKILTELFEPTKKDNGSIQCRFPARTQWLIQTLNIDPSSLPTQRCETLNAWLQKVNPKAVSLIFASEYLDSPPSAFAHSFLRFDNPEAANQYYLNFTPKVTEGEHFLKFAYKSSIGGNAGKFTMANYEQGIKEYLVDDGRNVWRYQLNLTDEQVQQLAYRTWEIKDQILPYYLLGDNCASEILVLLNAIFPNKNFLTSDSPMLSPAQVVRKLQRDHLIGATEFSPSKPTLAQAKLNQAYVDVKTSPSPTSNAQITPSRDNPILANPLSQIAIGIDHQSFKMINQKSTLDANHALTLKYRMVYRDALDKIDGYPIGSQLTGLTVGIRVNEDADQQDRIQLEQLGLFDVRAFHPINTAKKGNSWGANIGMQRVLDGINTGDPYHAQDHLVANLRGEFGKSYAFGSTATGSGDMPANICYGLGTIAAQFGKGLYHGYRTGVGVNVGCNAELNTDWRAITELSLPYWMSGDSDNERYWQPKLSLGGQYDINQSNAIRLTASREWLPKSENVKELDGVAIKWLHYFE